LQHNCRPNVDHIVASSTERIFPAGSLFSAIRFLLSKFYFLLCLVQQGAAQRHLHQRTSQDCDRQDSEIRLASATERDRGAVIQRFSPYKCDRLLVTRHYASPARTHSSLLYGRTFLSRGPLHVVLSRRRTVGGSFSAKMKPRRRRLPKGCEPPLFISIIP
jgi:hypothetical protein